MLGGGPDHAGEDGPRGSIEHPWRGCETLRGASRHKIANFSKTLPSFSCSGLLALTSAQPRRTGACVSIQPGQRCISLQLGKSPGLLNSRSAWSRNKIHPCARPNTRYQQAPLEAWMCLMVALTQGWLTMGNVEAGNITKPVQIKEKKGIAQVTQMEYRPSKHCSAVSYWVGDFESSESAGGK